MHLRWLPRALCTSLFLLAACDDQPDSASDVDAGLDAAVQPDLSCQAADYLVAMRLSMSFATLQDCRDDRDCVSLVFPTLECNGGQVHLPNCNVPLATGSVDAGAAALRALEEELCPRIMSPCVVGILCAPAHPACVSGRCEMVLDAGFTR